MVEETSWQCPICQAQMTPEIKDAHWAAHMRLGDQLPSPIAESAGRVLGFWLYCVLVGALGAAVMAVAQGHPILH